MLKVSIIYYICRLMPNRYPVIIIAKALCLFSSPPLGYYSLKNRQILSLMEIMFLSPTNLIIIYKHKVWKQPPRQCPLHFIQAKCIPSVCHFRGFNILTDGRKRTEEFCIRNRWRFGCQMLSQMIENEYKVVYFLTYCVFVPTLKGARHIPTIYAMFWW